MLVVIGSLILQEPNGAEVLKSLQTIGARYEVKELPLPTIAWLRESFNYGIIDTTEVRYFLHLSLFLKSLFQISIYNVTILHL